MFTIYNYNMSSVSYLLSYECFLLVFEIEFLSNSPGSKNQKEKKKQAKIFGYLKSSIINQVNFRSYKKFFIIIIAVYFILLYKSCKLVEFPNLLMYYIPTLPIDIINSENWKQSSASSLKSLESPRIYHQYTIF